MTNSLKATHGTLMTLCTFFIPTFVLSGVLFGSEIQDQWRYTLRRPAANWVQADFDDSSWQQGFGGFGTRDTPGAHVGTQWQTKNIWLRKTFDLDKVPSKAALLIHHDEDVEVYINGQQVMTLDGWSTEYGVKQLDADARTALKAGRNVLAVHCSQNTGGQFIDVHVIDADQVPELPRPQRATKPFQSELITTWGAKVTAENAWTEYPRPRLVRDHWQNLNGHWDYAITAVDQTQKPAALGRQDIWFHIVWNRKLGGVQPFARRFRSAVVPPHLLGARDRAKRTLLNFEAVDYRCEVFVNGQHGRPASGRQHRPSRSMSPRLVKHGDNELVVRVEDETEGWQLRGKQVLESSRNLVHAGVRHLANGLAGTGCRRDYLEELKIDDRCRRRHDHSAHRELVGRRDGRAAVRGRQRR